MAIKSERSSRYNPKAKNKINRKINNGIAYESHIDDNNEKGAIKKRMGD